MRESRKKKRKGNRLGIRRSGSRGVITVFVTLIMVPVVAITGMMVDVSRLKLYSSQAVMTADAYGEVVLSEFDNLLKELYGLFSVTQNAKGLEAIDTLADYMNYSFDPNGDDKGLSGFMPYKDADVELEYTKVDGASLSNNNVLMTQVADFMKYRIVEDVMDEMGVLSNLTQFDSLDSDMDAMENRKDITDSCAEALGEIDKYYRQLKGLAAYPEYIEKRQQAFEAYSSALTSIAASEEYAKYCNYLRNKAAIDEAKAKEARIEAAWAAAAAEEDEEAKKAKEPTETMTAEDYELCGQYVDVEAYKRSVRSQLNGVQAAAKDNSGYPINFDNTADYINSLGYYAVKLDQVLQKLEAQVEELKSKLGGCSDAVRSGIEEEIKELESIVEHADDFRETYNLIYTTHRDIENNDNNKQMMEREVQNLDNVRENLLNGNVQEGDSYWPRRVVLLWYDFRDDKASFYEMLQTLCDSEEADEDGDKKAGDKARKKADKERKKAEAELKADEQTDARDISSQLASQLGSNGGSPSEVPSLTDYFSGGLSLDNLSRAGSKVLDKFLLTSYDFGMFSSRVSGTRPEDEEAPAEGGEYADYSLTKVKMSKDVNYLYGAELEYLLGGYNKSVQNLNHARNIICGVRMTMNFASSYTISEINSAINAIADAAAAAVAATGIGAAAAPLVRVAVSGALRLAFATIESVADWKQLKERKSVVLLKTKLEDLEAADKLGALLGDKMPSGAGGGSKDGKLALTYEDYVYLLLCLLVDDNTQLNRTSNLITLNVNQAKNSGDTLTKLDFKMADTVTAVKATCKVKMDFVVVPENIMELYLKGTSTKSLIQVLEDHYFGYSVIRGY